jgi:hypothetical protein
MPNAKWQMPKMPNAEAGAFLAFGIRHSALTRTVSIAP